VTNLEESYRRLARPWTQEQLEACFRDAEHRGADDDGAAREPHTQPVAVLATAIPPAATLNVAIHTLHLLPRGNASSASQEQVVNELLQTAAKNAAEALHRANRTLELDGAAHGYRADEWLGAICDITAQLFESAKLESAPTTLVQAAQDSVSWLSRAVVELDQDSAETASTLAEVVARLLALWVFATEAPAP